MTGASSMRGRLAAVPAAGLLLAGTALPAAAQGYQGFYGYGPHMGYGGWHGGMFGPLMMILFVAVIVAIVVLLVRWLGGTGHRGHVHAPPSRTALDILKERYARGEIDKEEFEERRRVLGE